MSEAEKNDKPKKSPTSVTHEEVKAAASAARSKLMTMQKDIQSLLVGLDAIVKEGQDANFVTRDAIKTLLNDVEDTNPREVLKTLAKVHSARLLARAKEG